MTTLVHYESANALLASLQEDGFVVHAPVEVDEVAHRLGIVVDYDTSLEDRDIVGQISFTDDAPVVTINPIQNSFEPRRRFTLAHEIGHYCLHTNTSREGFTDSRKTMNRSDSYWDRYESEANAFAAQLLMPKTLLLEKGKAIIEAYRQQHNPKQGMPIAIFIEQMSHLFDVSHLAMEYRLKNLKLIA